LFKDGLIIKFEWDEDKNTHNIKKHDIDFNDVHTIFSGAIVEQVDDRMD